MTPYVLETEDVEEAVKSRYETIGYFQESQ